MTGSFLLPLITVSLTPELSSSPPSRLSPQEAVVSKGSSIRGVTNLPSSTWNPLWKLVVNSGVLEAEAEAGLSGPAPSQLHVAAAAWLRNKLKCGRSKVYSPPSGVGTEFSRRLRMM